MDFSIRDDRLELLDQPPIRPEDIQRNLLELAIINQQLGGHHTTWKGFSSLAEKSVEINVCEIGCGGGDNLKAIEQKSGENARYITFTGIDINPDCIEVAKSKNWKKPIRLWVSDYKKIPFPIKPDIIFCSLFCHHFKDPDLIEMLQWMRNNSRTGFFINDLHRHPLAYYSIRWLTSLFSKSYLVKHDAPLSVLRGFKKRELMDLLKKAGITHYRIRWVWAFRWLVIVRS
jgi:ubiquinone/menaquinone biosynthesis C-methylase UbiE